MAAVDTAPVEVDKAFAQIANADIEALLKQLTQDEKLALLTGSFVGLIHQNRKVTRKLTELLS